jgi:hypothetical protein
VITVVRAGDTKVTVTAAQVSKPSRRLAATLPITYVESITSTSAQARNNGVFDELCERVEVGSSGLVIVEGVVIAHVSGSVQCDFMLHFDAAGVLSAVHPIPVDSSPAIPRPSSSASKAMMSMHRMLSDGNSYILKAVRSGNGSVRFTATRVDGEYEPMVLEVPNSALVAFSGHRLDSVEQVKAVCASVLKALNIISGELSYLGGKLGSGSCNVFSVCNCVSVAA